MSVSQGGSRQTTAAQRDTLFIRVGPAATAGRGNPGADNQHWQPSRLVNTSLLNTPHYLASWVQNASDQRRAVPPARSCS